jgi:hypothetical protein
MKIMQLETLASYISLNRRIRFLTVTVVFIFFHFASSMNDGFTKGPVICIFRIFTGQPCPACGTTRALGALAEGKIIESLNFNPLGIVILLSAILWIFSVSKNGQRTNVISEKFTTLNSAAKISTILLIITLVCIWNLSRW